MAQARPPCCASCLALRAMMADSSLATRAPRWATWPQSVSVPPGCHYHASKPCALTPSQSLPPLLAAALAPDRPIPNLRPCARLSPPPPLIRLATCPRAVMTWAATATQCCRWCCRETAQWRARCRYGSQGAGRGTSAVLAKRQAATIVHSVQGAVSPSNTVQRDVDRTTHCHGGVPPPDNAPGALTPLPALPASPSSPQEYQAALATADGAATPELAAAIERMNTYNAWGVSDDRSSDSGTMAAVVAAGLQGCFQGAGGFTCQPGSGRRKGSSWWPDGRQPLLTQRHASRSRSPCCPPPPPNTRTHPPMHPASGAGGWRGKARAGGGGLTRPCHPPGQPERWPAPPGRTGSGAAG